MLSMTEDDAAYTALLTQLLSDSASTRNARVHSWIEHQYDFAFSEHPHKDIRDSCPTATSRAPSPSPSSSLGAHRTFSVDRPDSPLLPRFSSDRPVSPRNEPCPSYDALFFPPPNPPTEDEQLEEHERARALRFLVQEMAHWKLQNASATTLDSVDKPLPAPPPSPASSLTQSTSSRAMRSRSSSMRISRLPSFTSTLSSEQSQLQDSPPPLPVSVIVHGEYQHDLVLREDPLVDSCLRTRSDPFHLQDNEVHLLPPLPDEKDSVYPSPTLSNFSCAYSRETALTTPYASSPASPVIASFDSSACLPENIALPASPVEESGFFGESSPTRGHERAPSYADSFVSSSTAFPASSRPVSPPITTVLPASPVLSYFPTVNADAISVRPQHLRAPKSEERTQSRWSVATTASLTLSTAEPKTGSFLRPSSPPKVKKDKGLKTPKKRTRFISLISRFSPGRIDPSSTTSSAGDDVDYDSANESENDDYRGKSKKKPMSKKSSLASLRASFSISRTSFSSQRPPLASPIEEVPPLPSSPSRTSFNASRPSLIDVMASDVVPPLPKISPSKIPARANQPNSALPPIPQSASTITSFQISSQVSIHESLAASASRVSLLSPQNTSEISLLPPPSKRTSLASAAGIEPMVPTTPISASQTPNRSKSIFRLTVKPKSPRTPSGIPSRSPTSKLPKAGTSLPSPTSPTSRIPPPSKFTPPAKLATVIAAQSHKVPPPPASPPTSKLPTPPSRTPTSKIAPRAPLTINVEKASAMSSPPPSTPTVSRLPMPASTKATTRTGTVKGFWRRQ